MSPLQLDASAEQGELTIAPRYEDAMAKDILYKYPNAAFMWLAQAGYAKYVLKKPLVTDECLAELFIYVRDNWDRFQSAWKQSKKPQVLSDMEFTSLPSALLVSLEYRLKKVYPQGVPVYADAPTLPPVLVRVHTIGHVVASTWISMHKGNSIADKHGFLYRGQGEFDETFEHRMDAVLRIKALAADLVAKGYTIKDYWVHDVILRGSRVDTLSLLPSKPGAT